MRNLMMLPAAAGLVFALSGCFGDPGTAGEGSGSGSGDSSATQTGDDGNDGEDGDGTGDDGNDGDGNDDDGNDGTGDDGNDDDGNDDDGNDGTEDPKWDTLAIPDAAPCGGPGGGGGNDDPDFSYIWVANSQQHTISKIDTVTMIEEGRYMTRPDGQGSPSRTSVSLTGNVTTANRQGGVTMVYAVTDNCEESNGMPGIQTATDANYLQWDVEECRAWHTPMNYASQRPLAWAPGTWNNKSCGYEDEMVWTAGTSNSSATVDVLLLDGDDGSIADQVEVVGMQSSFYGIYGAAVDGDGHMWGSQLGGGKLIRVDRDDMTYQLWQTPAGGYGMTVDHEGYPWTCSSSIAKFDPETETWQSASTGGSGGCMGDGDEYIWQAGSNGSRAVNRETLQVEKTIPFPNYVHGVSIDFYGYVWGVSMQTQAYRGDPETLQFDTFNGLTGPYTYSDMTGFALKHAGSIEG